MGYNDEIEVEYDKEGVPLPHSDRDGNAYSVIISRYFYNRLNSIDNNDEFDSEELEVYNLEESNGKINISTTTKLINYLKSFVKSYAKHLTNDIEEYMQRLESENRDKVDKSEYLSHVSDMNDRLDTIVDEINNFTNKIYPVGSIYMSFSPTDPSTLFGGTWLKLENKFLLGSGTRNVNVTGGEENHTLTVNEMPVHTHSQNAHNHAPKENSSYSGLTFLVGVQNASFTSSNYYSLSTLKTGKASIVYTTHASGLLNPNVTANSIATNNNTGGGKTHNNMPPYVVVHMWRRIS